MTLALSSVLHYWTARYGAMPIVGGKPTHSRSSAATWADQQGVIQTQIVNTPRMQWASIDSERRQVMRLEAARSNIIEGFSNPWSYNSISATGGQTDAAGGLLAYLFATTSAGGDVRRTVTFTADGEKVFSVFLKAGSAAVSEVGIYDVTIAAWRHRISVTWTNGVASATATVNGAGTRFPITELGGGWYRISFSATGVVAANSNLLELYPATSGGSGSVYAYGPQAENATSPSSFIATTTVAPVTRAVDSFYWDFFPVPQGLMAYVRLRRGHRSGRIFQVSDATAAAPYFGMNGDAMGVFHHNGTTQVSASASGTSAIGDTLEAIAMLKSDGKVRVLQSVNGAAPTDSGESAANALATAWSASRLYLNADGTSGGDVGLSDFAEVKLVKYADVAASTAAGIMDELRAFELGPNGAVL